MIRRLLGKSTVKTFALVACLGIAGIYLGGCSSREQRAQNYYNRGMSYLEKNDHVKARIELRNALQIDNKMVAAWQAISKMDEQERKWPALAGDLRRIIELAPKDVDAKLRLGRLLLLGRGYDQALKVAKEAEALDPKNVSVLALKAAILFKLKDSDGALQTAQEAVAIDPDNTEARVVLAATQFMRKDSKAALETLDKVKVSNKDDVGVVFMELNIFNQLGDVDQVEKLLRRLVEVYPKVPAFRAQLIRFYVAHNRPDDAEKELRQVVAANPEDAVAELDLASLLGRLKGQDAARDELVKRIAAGGKVFPFQLALAKLDFTQGRFDDSVKELKKLIDDSKATDEVMASRIALAEIYMKKNDVPAAEPLVSDILQVDSRNVNGLMMRASIHLFRSQYDDAIADLRTALNDQPQSPELLANLAIAYERSGAIDLADKAFADAMKASRYSPVVGLNYVAFLKRRGAINHAESVVTDLASRNPNSTVVLTALAQIKLEHKDWADAHTLADKIRKIGDKSDVADQIDGAAFSGEKKVNDSLAALQDAYDAHPGASRPLAALVAAYMQAKQADKATEVVEAALKTNPDNAEAYILSGSIKLTKSDTDGAAKDFEAAIKSQPKDSIGYKALADLYARERKFDDAEKTLHDGLEQLPKNFTLRLSAAGVQELKGDFEAAISLYEDMLKDQPGSMVVANNLASLLADHRSDKASLDRASQLALLLTKSQVPQFKDTLGWVAYRRDDYDHALPLLEGAGAELPNNALVHYHLGMGYMATGKNAKAADEFKKARDLATNDAALMIKIDAADKNLAEKTKG